MALCMGQTGKKTGNREVKGGSLLAGHLWRVDLSDLDVEGAKKGLGSHDDSSVSVSQVVQV